MLRAARTSAGATLSTTADRRRRQPRHGHAQQRHQQRHTQRANNSAPTLSDRHADQQRHIHASTATGNGDDLHFVGTTKPSRAPAPSIWPARGNSHLRQQRQRRPTHDQRRRDDHRHRQPRRRSIDASPTTGSSTPISAARRSSSSPAATSPAARDFTNVGAGLAEATNGGTLRPANGGNFSGGGFRRSTRPRSASQPQRQRHHARHYRHRHRRQRSTPPRLTNVTLATAPSPRPTTTITYLCRHAHQQRHLQPQQRRQRRRPAFRRHERDPRGHRHAQSQRPRGDRVYAQNGSSDRLTIATGATISGHRQPRRRPDHLHQQRARSTPTRAAPRSTIQPGGGTADFTDRADRRDRSDAAAASWPQDSGSFTNNGTYAVDLQRHRAAVPRSRWTRAT